MSTKEIPESIVVKIHKLIMFGSSSNAWLYFTVAQTHNSREAASSKYVITK